MLQIIAYVLLLLVLNTETGRPRSDWSAYLKTRQVYADQRRAIPLRGDYCAITQYLTVRRYAWMLYCVAVPGTRETGCGHCILDAG
jgi:hypothetical protein